MQRITWDNPAYREAKAKLPKPDGKHCIICGEKLPKFKRKYCSPKCWHKWYHDLAPPKNWSEVRQKVFERDNYACQKCGRRDKDMECDHIIPIALGGDMWGMDNLQTLCHEHHADKTRKDLEKIKEQKQIPVLLRQFYEAIELMERNLNLWSRF